MHNEMQIFWRWSCNQLIPLSILIIIITLAFTTLCIQFQTFLKWDYPWHCKKKSKGFSRFWRVSVLEFGKKQKNELSQNWVGHFQCLCSRQPLKRIESNMTWAFGLNNQWCLLIHDITTSKNKSSVWYHPDLMLIPNFFIGKTMQNRIRKQWYLTVNRPDYPCICQDTKDNMCIPLGRMTQPDWYWVSPGVMYLCKNPNELPCCVSTS